MKDMVKSKMKEHSQHASWHDIVGFFAIIFSIMFLLFGGFANSISVGFLQNLIKPIGWSTVLFNVSLILIAAALPIGELSKVKTGSSAYMHIYWMFLFMFSGMAAIFQAYGLGTPLEQAMWNPATINFLAGGLFLMGMDLMEHADNGADKMLGAVIMIILTLTTIYLIPWQNAPSGPIQRTGMAMKQQLEPAAQAMASGAAMLRPCARGFFGSPEQMQTCQESVRTFISNVEGFLRAIPGGEYALAMLYMFTQRGMNYATAMNCVGSKGGLANIAYDTNVGPGQYGNETPSGEVEDCFSTNTTVPGGVGPGSDGSQSGGSWQTLNVNFRQNHARAVMTFSGTVKAGSVSTSDFTIQSPKGLGKSDTLVSGKQVTLVMTGYNNVNDGQGVVIALAGDGIKVGGQSVSSGSCADNYNDGKATSCG